MASNSCDSNFMSEVTQFQTMNNYFIKYNNWLFLKEFKYGFHCNQQVFFFFYCNFTHLEKTIFKNLENNE